MDLNSLIPEGEVDFEKTRKEFDKKIEFLNKQEYKEIKTFFELDLYGEELWQIYFKAKGEAALKIIGNDEDVWATQDQVHQFEISGLKAVAEYARKNCFR